MIIDGWRTVFVDGRTATPNTIDLYDIMEIIHRLSGKKFSDDERRRIAEAVGWVSSLLRKPDIGPLHLDHCGNLRIFSFQCPGFSLVSIQRLESIKSEFIPSFHSSSFVIPISDGTDSTILTQPNHPNSSIAKQAEEF